MSAPITTYPFVALVTGANRGLGLEFVRQLINGRDSSIPVSAGFIAAATGKSDVPAFVPSDAVVIATARDPSTATELNELAAASSGRVYVAKYEATSNDDVAALTKLIDEKYGRLDLVVMNAGIVGTFCRDDLSEVDTTDFAHVLNVNAIAPIALASALLPVLRRTLKHKLKESGRNALVPATDDSHAKAAKSVAQEVAAGARARTAAEVAALAASPVKVVFVSSIMGSMLATTSPAAPAYCASKAALNSFVRTFALTATGIAVASLHPGWVQTDMGSSMGRPPVTPSQSIAGMLDVIDRVDASKAPEGMIDFKGRLIPF